MNLQVLQTLRKNKSLRCLVNDLKLKDQVLCSGSGSRSDLLSALSDLCFLNQNHSYVIEKIIMNYKGILTDNWFYIIAFETRMFGIK